MRIAIIGSGISGMTSAYLLSEDHEVVVYEANDYIGGHTNTVDVSLNNAIKQAWNSVPVISTLCLSNAAICCGRPFTACCGMWCASSEIPKSS